MRRPEEVIFPIENLEILFPTSKYQAKVRPDARQNRVTNRDMAGRCGVTGNAVQAWRNRGLRYRTADAVACHLGVHPSAIWPDEWQEVLDYERTSRNRTALRRSRSVVTSPEMVAS